MKVWPVLLDSAPAYLGQSSEGASLFCAPMGRELLASQLYHQIEQVTADAPTIVAPRGASPEYRARLTAAYPGATIATSSKELAAVLRGAETSDVLLFVDPRCMPGDVTQLASLMEASAEQPQIAWHLVAFTADIAGTRESVDVDDDGLVQSVHRYYKPATWPFIAGVAASLVPVSSGILPLQAIPESLYALRQKLSSRGVPSRDVALTDGAFDLAEEHGMLAAMESSVRECTAEAVHDNNPPLVLVGDGHAIDPTARLLGPMVIQAGARIDAGATVVGPALIGAGSHIGAGAIVAHVSLGANARVAAGRVLRDRAWYSTVDEADSAYAEPAPPTFTQRLARFGFDDAEPVVPLAPAGIRAAIYRAFKRGFDATLATIALLVLSPILALVALLVKLDSRGPVFFKHTREGVGERPFHCIKFRTMQVGANDLQRRLKAQDKLDGPHFKMESDPRITRLGRWLRASNVDELPQLMNVVLGDMSLVGPRPSPFRENQICVPWRNGRLSVRPGITGLWQVCRQDRAAGDFHQWIEYDLLYVQHMNLFLDLKVLAATVFTLGGKHPVPVSWLLHVPARPAHHVPSRRPIRVARIEDPARSEQR